MPFQTEFSALTIAHRTRRFHTLPPSPREGLSVVEDVQITVQRRRASGTWTIPPAIACLHMVDLLRLLHYSHEIPTAYGFERGDTLVH